MWICFSLGKYNIKCSQTTNHRHTSSTVVWAIKWPMRVNNVNQSNNMIKALFRSVYTLSVLTIYNTSLIHYLSLSSFYFRLSINHVYFIKCNSRNHRGFNCTCSATLSSSLLQPISFYQCSLNILNAKNILMELWIIIDL